MTELDKYGRIEDIVISSRIRIARNIDKYKFPQSMNVKEANSLTGEMLEIMAGSDDRYDFHKIKDLTTTEKTSLVEDHLISPALYRANLRGGFFLRDDKKVTLMINEEDHLRIQALFPGFNLRESWKTASELDDYIESKIGYAFHEKFGYLTSCPTNVGTGLRASIMVHLPAIKLTNNLKELVEILRKVGLTLRGLYGEGSKGFGSLYQISNQTTLGQSEEEIIDKLEKIVLQVIDRERSTRKFLMDKGRISLEDKIIRSYGLLNYNRKINTEEAMTYISDVKLGMDLGILEGTSSESLKELTIDIQPGKIQCRLEKELNKKERDIERSNYIREFLKKEE